MATITTLFDQTTDLTLKTQAGEPACTTSISGMTPEVAEAAIALINGFTDDLHAAIIASSEAGASEAELLPFNDLKDQILTDTDALVALVSDNL